MDPRNYLTLAIATSIAGTYLLLPYSPALADPLSDRANTIWKESHQNKGLIFDFLRANSPTSDSTLATYIQSIFATGTDDLWLAETIMKNGPEPLWPLADITERQRRAMAHSWPPEPGIQATLGTGRRIVQAYYFRGTSDRRALIIGGVHGSEPGGVEAVRDLLSILRTANGPMPFYSVIVVPELFSTNVDSERRASAGTVRAIISGRAGRVSAPDPNSQFPTTGSDPGSNPTLGCVVDSQQRCIEPENLVLIDLINRFQPERVASVHGHTVENNTAAMLVNGGPGITVVPRPGHEKEDQALALSMAQEAQRLGVRIPGNFLGTSNQTTRYPRTAVHMSTGVSLGRWGSHVTPTRPAMNMILIETYGNTTSSSSSLNSAQRAARRTELMNLAQVLRNVFLADPSSLTSQGVSNPPY